MVPLTQKIESFYKFMPRREFEYHIHISTQNSYMYFEVPKVACSTTKLALQQLEATTAGLSSPSEEMSIIHNKKQSSLLSPSDIGLDQFCEMLNDSSVFKFSFVRNPYTRVLSAFLSKINWQKSTYREKIARSLNIEPNSSISFKRFINFISEQSVLEMDPHWRPQVDQLFFNLVAYDFIGFFENFEEDLQKALQYIVLNKDKKNNLLEQKNEKIAFKGRKTNSSQKIESYYNPEIQSLISTIYQDDFVKFGYPLDIN